MQPISFFLLLALLPASPSLASEFGDRLAAAAMERTTHTVRYDGSYRHLAYPGGDVPDSQGVCTDVVIRAYRKLGMDLQVLVHEDMRSAFYAYPPLWGLKNPDRNIDHRRVPNLQTFFARQGTSITNTDSQNNLLPGDVLTWMLPGNLPHTGIVVAANSKTHPVQIVHNIGAGPQMTDISPNWKLTGHFRYGGPS